MNKAISVTSERCIYQPLGPTHANSLAQGHLHSMTLFCMVHSACQKQNKLFFNVLPPPFYFLVMKEKLA
jgi:hypothetical protein